MESRELLSESGLILAADVSDLASLNRLVSTCAPFTEVVAVKIGFSLGLRFSLKEVVHSIKAVKNYPVIYDHQKAGTDIPAMGKVLASLCQEAGLESFIIFPQAGPKTLESFVVAAKEANLIPIVGLVMTHQSYLESEGGFIVDKAPDMILDLSLKLGVRNFVLPGTKTDIIRRYALKIFSMIGQASILMPGIGSQGGDIASVFQAAHQHHAFAIVGSAIYNSPSPQPVFHNDTDTSVASGREHLAKTSVVDLHAVSMFGIGNSLDDRPAFGLLFVGNDNELRVKVLVNRFVETGRSSVVGSDK
ncbi:TPA: hypothetical protein DIV45_01215 [Patescibacteria group bacterium]|nr:hypothetical protein [Patescibacteria group bacterium]